MARLPDGTFSNASVEELDELFKRAKEDRQQYEQQWLTNLAFYMDRHHLVWDRVQRTLKARRVPKWRVLSTVNLVRGTVRTEYAKLIQNRPEAKAQPASDDPDDENQARACDDLLAYLWHIDGSEGAWERAIMWSLLTGTGVLKAYWNKTSGKALTEPEQVFTPDGILVPNPKAGAPLKDRKGEPVHLGDVEVCEVSPFEFYPDPFGIEMRHKSWAFYVKMRSPEYVFDRYGVKVDPSRSTESFEAQMGAMMGNTAEPATGVVVKEFFQKPGKKYPKGRYVVYANEQLLEATDNPYPKTPLPFAAMTHIPVPGRFWGDAIVTSIIDPQRILNKAHGQAVEHTNLMAKGKYFVPKGALDPGQTITSAPGEIVRYNVVPGAPDNGRPKMEQGAAVPDSMWKLIDLAKQNVNDVSGVNEVSRADLPSGQKLSGIGIAYLQEQDDTRLSPTARSGDRAMADLAKVKLHLARENYDEPRTLRILGENNRVRMVEFRKEDIPEDVDVRVVAGSSLPKSRLAKQQFVLELWEKKVLTDPRDVVDMLEFGEVKGMYADLRLDISQAERENEALKGGTVNEDGSIAVPMVADFHNHEVHLKEHNKVRKTEEYERLAAENPAVAQAFEEHVQAHKAALVQAALLAAATSATPDVRSSVEGQELPMTEPPEMLPAA